MLCPRREEVFSPVFKLPTEDQWRDDGTCSFCGSMNPDQVLELLLDGEVLILTDKNYKAYIGKGQERGKFYYQHFSDEQCRTFVKLLNDGKINYVGPGKLPYFVRVPSSPWTSKKLVGFPKDDD